MSQQSGNGNMDWASGKARFLQLRTPSESQKRHPLRQAVNKIHRIQITADVTSGLTIDVTSGFTAYIFKIHRRSTPTKHQNMTSGWWPRHFLYDDCRLTTRHQYHSHHDSFGALHSVLTDLWRLTVGGDVTCGFNTEVLTARHQCQ